MPTPEPTPLRAISILLVEDDLDLLELLAEFLETRGAQVVRAATFALARRALVEQRFDLLVSDIELPDGNGHALLSERPERVGAAVVLTGKRDGDSMDASRAAGFHAHLIKPCDPEILARVAATLTT